MIIGITGGIGSGKSRVTAFWAAFFGHSLLDLDAICRELLLKGNPGWHALRAQLSNRFFEKNGNLDRVMFRKAIFADNLLRKVVDDVLHPLAKLRMKEQCPSSRGETYLVEIPLLYEAKWQQDLDRIVVVVADQETRLARIIARDNVSKQESIQALRAQMPLIQKALVADHVIENHGSWAATCLQILHLGRMYAEK
jgi:dephospho-CoA kinase